MRVVTGANLFRPSPSEERDSAQGAQGEGRFRRITPAADLRCAREARADMTEAEDRLWTALRNRRLNGWKFKRQLPIGKFRPDFVCAVMRLIVEVDGSQHADNASRDIRRTQILERDGYRVIRFWNNEVLGQLDLVLDAILAALSPHPARAVRESTLPPEGEGK